MCRFSSLKIQPAGCLELFQFWCQRRKASLPLGTRPSRQENTAAICLWGFWGGHKSRFSDSHSRKIIFNHFTQSIKHQTFSISYFSNPVFSFWNKSANSIPQKNQISFRPLKLQIYSIQKYLQGMKVWDTIRERSNISSYPRGRRGVWACVRKVCGRGGGQVGCGLTP